MAINIIVEDGTQVANANSFVSIADARIYAANRGIALPPIDDDLAVMLIKACDYLEAQAEKFQGVKTSTNQVLQWPRTGVYIYGALCPPNIIPKSLISAQVQLAMAINAGLDLQPNVSASDYVIREKVGPIETEYANPFNVGIVPTFTAANSLLAPLLSSSVFSLRTIRI